jgi:acetyl esterase
MSGLFYPTYTAGTLHPESQRVLEEIRAAASKPLVSMTPDEARADFLPSAWLGEPRPNVTVRSRTLPGPAGPIPVKAYTPAEAGPWPILVFYHGGGFVLGALEEFDTLCTFLAEGSGCLVVSVGYRLAPEARFPAALEDASAALAWVADHGEELGGDPAQIAVAGDSAGGNLAAGVALQAAQAGSPELALQVLLCPWVDLSDGAEAAPSFHHFGEGLWLSRANIRWYRDHYVETPAQADHPLASPLKAKTLAGLPPALVLTAEFDVLADQGRAYAQRLEADGVPVTFRAYPGMLHDFVTLPGKFSEARTAIRQITEALRAALQGRVE